MSFTALSHRSRILAALFVLALAAPHETAAAQAPLASAVQQAPAPRTEASRARVEYALYSGNGVDGSRLFATAETEVRGKNWREFAQRLQAQRFPAYPRTEPAFFTWLAERGWELVECERREEVVALLGDRDLVTRCHFRRTVAGGAAPANGDADASGR